ncbi:MAG: hypothetical protein II336_20460 [Loktanella sp.]|nr:hypothetical protein [Loktanella sp.]
MLTRQNNQSKENIRIRLLRYAGLLGIIVVKGLLICAANSRFVDEFFGLAAGKQRPMGIGWLRRPILQLFKTISSHQKSMKSGNQPEAAAAFFDSISPS